MTLTRLVFGWPLIALSIALFAFAFLRGRWTLAAAGVIAATPFLWYASHAPGGLLWSPVLFVALLAAVWLLGRGRRGWALVCVTPYVVWVFVIGVAVVSQ